MRFLSVGLHGMKIITDGGMTTDEKESEEMNSSTSICLQEYCVVGYRTFIK